MSKKYLKTNLYNKNGGLLLSKGYELSETMIKKLETIDHIDIGKAITERENSRHEKDVTYKTEQIRKNMGLHYTRYMDSASEILIGLLHESKNQPWWFYINTLSNYIDWQYTHSINVSILSIMIAMSLKINGLKEIALGALFHDIGKLMIPKSIIQKPGKLTDEEFYYIRQHCDLGISMVKDFNLSQISLDIIHQHHERLNGSGYPQGLTGAEIPVHSRIAMIADILDAMTTYRPYRSGKPIKSAINELREDSAKYPLEILEKFDAFFN